MRAIIISGGSISDYDYIREQALAFIGEKKEHGIIIAADSGYDHSVKLNLAVDLIVGDFDSVEQTPPPDVKIIRHSAKKDFTDTELALTEARSMGARELLFLAATGTRANHTLTNILMLKDCLEHGQNAEIIDEHNKIKITKSVLSLSGNKGDLVSLVPLCDCTGVCTGGLQYRLDYDDLKVGGGRGVSNVMSDRSAFVCLKDGILLVIMSKD